MPPNSAMSDFNQDTVPKTLGGPGLLHNGGPTVPSDNTSMDLVAPMAPHASQSFTRDSLESTPGQSMAPDPVAQAHQAIFTSSACALPPSLLAQQIAYNFPASSSRPPTMATPPPPPPPHPFPSSPSATPDQATTTTTPVAPTRKPYRKTPLSELSAPEKEARQKLLAACEQDRELFLAFLKEHGHNGGLLAPERVVVLKKVFKHYTMSSFPASASGIEANRKARREGLAEIAHAKAARMEVSGGHQAERIGDVTGGGGSHGGESSAGGGSVPEENNTRVGNADGEGKVEQQSEDPITAGAGASSTSKTFEGGQEERISDGITLSYSLNGKECTKEELDDARRSRYPRTVAPPPTHQTPPQTATPLPIAAYLHDHHSPPVSHQQYSYTQQQQIPGYGMQSQQQMRSQQMGMQQMHPQQMHTQQPQSQQQQSGATWGAPPYQGQYFPGYPPWL